MADNLNIGIGITTRNRPHVLQTALDHFAAYPVKNARIVIIDDASDTAPTNRAIVDEFERLGVFDDVQYLHSPDRLGIAKAKNACLARLTDCEHVFLFDDDCWPQHPNWADQWIHINRANSIQHSMFNVGMDALLDRNPAFKAEVKAKTVIGIENTIMVAYNNCFGVMLYFTRECLDAIGGYDTNTPHLYGYEHAQVSKRIGSLGRFTRNEMYWTPWAATDLIYSVDISYCMLRLEPQISAPWLPSFISSVTVDEMSRASENAPLMDRNETYIPLVDPISPG